MFAELVELGRRVYKGHDALGEEKCNWDIVIDHEGNFKKFIPCDITIKAEKLSAKKGKARLLVDKPEETLLGYKNPQEVSANKGKTEVEKKNERYLNKLNEYKDLQELAPVFSFYSKPTEVRKAIDAFKGGNGNMTFMLEEGNFRFAELEPVRDAIKRKYEKELHAKHNNNCKCSICGTNEYPILDESHGSITMPKGQQSGSMLVSYNKPAFESYNLKGNINSGICTNCARNYIEALKFLTTNEYDTHNLRGTNRQDISDDTIALFWTKKPNENVDPWSDICEPTVERIKRMFASVAAGDSNRVDIEVDNFFYCCTLSSAAARIAVRDWMVISISQYQNNLKQWFKDIATIKDGEVYYPGINTILKNCIKEKAKPTQGDFKARTRIGTMLWHAALTKSSLPLMILQSVLSQIEHDKSKTGFKEEKSTVIRLVLNRNNKNRRKMENELDEQNVGTAYLCGRLFALICKLQYMAQGKVNCSIKDRFFASASNSPARVMGLLLTKYVPIYEKKTKGAYSTSITEIAAHIGHFPDKFSVTERGEFALGFYYQYNNTRNKNNNEQ